MRAEILAAPSEAPAHVLAMMVSADGRIDERELNVLDELDGFRRLRVTRRRFVELAQACRNELGAGLCERSWLRAEELDYIDALLDAVSDAELRLLLCRLASAVLVADGKISHDERRVYDHVLARWRIGQEQVTHAILAEKAH
jgi:tellurite resistance protein